MSREKQLLTLKNQRLSIINELEKFYKNEFNRIVNLNINDNDIAKLSQLLLQSKDGAIAPMKKEIEKQLITKANIQ